MSVILLRVRGGLDYSAHIVDEELVEPEVMMMTSEISFGIIVIIHIIVRVILRVIVIIIIIIIVTILPPLYSSESFP